MSTDNYITVRKVRVVTPNREFDQWWAWHLSTSINYVDYQDHIYEIVMDGPASPEDPSQNGTISPAPRFEFSSIEDLNKWIDDISAVDYGISPTTDHQVFQDSPITLTKKPE